MEMTLTSYLPLLQALFVSLLLLVLQWLIDTMAKGSRPGAIPGTFPPDLGHDSFVFRVHRTFLNSLENYPLWLGTVLLVIMSGTDPSWSAILGWLFVAGRVGHMALYYLIATERNPSPRSGFFVLSWIANVALLVMAGLHLFSIG